MERGGFWRNLVGVVVVVGQAGPSLVPRQAHWAHTNTVNSHTNVALICWAVTVFSGHKEIQLTETKARDFQGTCEQ